MKYSAEITYTSFNGGSTTCGVDGCETQEQAWYEALELAYMDGWTQPKWWQWWRWGDTRVKHITQPRG